jgi:hypothetical protein
MTSFVLRGNADELKSSKALSVRQIFFIFYLFNSVCFVDDSTLILKDFCFMIARVFFGIFGGA